MKQTQNFPKELLFVGRSMNLVRSLNKHHGGIADRITIMAKSAYVGSQTEDCNRKYTSNIEPRTGLSYNWSTLFFNASILVLKTTNWLLKKLSGKYIDEYVEHAEAKEAQKIFVKYGFKALDENAYNA